MAGNVARILIDGISGSGKTTLADTFASQGFLVLHSDRWAPGWSGLRAASETTRQLLNGTRDSYPEWDWDNDRVGREVPVDPSKPWVIEGCGSLTEATARLANLCIWVETPVEVAKARALQRDGDLYRPWWDYWHAQEVAHWERNNPARLADLTILSR